MNKVLLIDDDMNFRRVLRHHLCRMGCQVEEAAGTELTIGRCETERYTLIVLGWNWTALRSVVGVLLVFGIAYLGNRFVRPEDVPSEPLQFALSAY